MRTLLAGLLLILSSLSWAEEPPAYIASEIPQAAITGQGVLRWFGIRVYEAKLWTENGHYSPEKPHALQLIYGHDFSAKNLAQEGAKQMRKQGIAEEQITRWTPVMQDAFTDVKAGDSLTALLLPDQSLRFFSNGKLVTTVHDPEFSRSFLDIWLGSKTTEPKLRLKLIGSS